MSPPRRYGTGNPKSPNLAGGSSYGIITPDPRPYFPIHPKTMIGRELFIGLENLWPENKPVGDLVPGKDYFRIGGVILIAPHVQPRRIEAKPTPILLIGYRRIPTCRTRQQIRQEYPELRKWSRGWPRPVGRYHLGPTMVVDVIFGREDAPCPEEWSDIEKNEWLHGFHGYWTGWTYDLRFAPLGDFVMRCVNEIPPGERTPHRVTRHLLSAMSSENRKDALLVGRWEEDFKGGKPPWKWRCTADIFKARVQERAPVKYAQCWIFSECLTSMLRFIGLPSRTVFAINAKIDRGRDGGVDFGLCTPKSDLTTFGAEGGASNNESGEKVYHSVDADIFRDEIIASSQGEFYALVVDSDRPLISSTPKGDRQPRQADRVYPDSPTQDVPIGFNVELDLRKYVLADGKDDAVWNFHLWNEVCLPSATYPGGEWYCLDASPIIETDSLDEYTEKKILGPCPVSCLKAGRPSEHDFHYLNSTVNSVYRFWRQEVLAGGETVVYPYHISWNQFEQSKVSNHRVTVFVRDPLHSVGRKVIRSNITRDYVPESREKAEEIYLSTHPMVFEWLKPDRLSCRGRPQLGNYYIQFCFLTGEGSLIKCYRQRCRGFHDLLHTVIPETTEAISIFIADLNPIGGHPNWWASVVYRPS